MSFMFCPLPPCQHRTVQSMPHLWSKAAQLFFAVSLLFSSFSVHSWSSFFVVRVGPALSSLLHINDVKHDANVLKESYISFLPLHVFHRTTNSCLVGTLYVSLSVLFFRYLYCHPCRQESAQVSHQSSLNQ
jgi:hypothetical protein